MSEIFTRYNGTKLFLKEDNEDFVWVKEFVDDNGQIYYESGKPLSRYTTKLNNAETTPLNCVKHPNYKLVKITYEILDVGTTNMMCGYKNYKSKQLCIKGTKVDVDRNDDWKY